MYLLATFNLQNLEKILRANPELWCAIFRPKIAQFVLKKLFLVQTIIIIFIYLLAIFIVQNFKKFLLRIQSYEGPKWSICPKQFFFWKIINIIIIYLLAPFIVQNFKKILPADPELWRCTIFDLKWPISPKNFFQKTC